jgi:2-polyprenyl-6-methoxyphenol hydroxylase-like FAD-dependent oxidoreductase
MKAIIVGAGIGGLTLGLELIRGGVDVEIYERAQTLQPVGAGIMLAPNAIKVLGELGLSQKLENLGNKVTRTAIQDSIGEPISTVDMTFGVQQDPSSFSLALHRGALHNLLVEEVGPEKIKLGQTYLSSEDTQDCIFALFDSGDTARGDFLVGCDGVRSAVRTKLFGSAKRRYSGQLCWRVTRPRRTWGRALAWQLKVQRYWRIRFVKKRLWTQHFTNMKFSGFRALER